MFETPVLQTLRQGNSWGSTVSRPELHGECQVCKRVGEKVNKRAVSEQPHPRPDTVLRPPQTKTWLPLDFITQSRAIQIQTSTRICSQGVA